MKKKYILYGIILALILSIIAACFWYFTPKSFLKGVDSNEISSISVFAGNTGQLIVLDDTEDIATIVKNIQSNKMKRGKFSSNYDGFAFSLTFKDKDGNEIDRFIINSKNVIGDDLFFYKCENGELCYDFLSELVNQYSSEE
jgi:hypothetical protein